MHKNFYPDLEERATVTYLSPSRHHHADDLVDLFPVYKERNWRKGAAFAGVVLLAGAATKFMMDRVKEAQ